MDRPTDSDGVGERAGHEVSGGRALHDVATRVTHHPRELVGAVHHGKVHDLDGRTDRDSSWSILRKVSKMRPGAAIEARLPTIQAGYCNFYRQL